MRTLIISLLLSIISLSIGAQVIIFENRGEAISKKDSLKIDRIIKYEAEFYSKLFTYDTIQVNLRIFEKKNEYIKFLLDNKLPMADKRFTGKYSSKFKECLTFRNKELDKDVFFSSVCFLTSSAIRHQGKGKKSPYWLRIGLNQYFKRTIISKKEIKPEMPEFEIGKIKQMIEQDELGLVDFISLKRKEFIKKQIHEDRYSYTLAHGLVYFLVNKDFEIFKEIVTKISSGNNSFAAIDSSYPGGFEQFKTDFIKYYQNL